MKNYLFPSQERLRRFGKSCDDKCFDYECQDGHGHYLVCQSLSPCLSPIWKYFQDNNIEQLVNCEYNGIIETVFPLAWLVSYISLYIWDCKRKNKNPKSTTLNGQWKVDMSYLYHVSSLKKYVPYLSNYIDTLVT